MVLNEISIIIIIIISVAVAVCVFTFLSENRNRKYSKSYHISKGFFFCLFFIPNTYFAYSVMTNFKLIPLHYVQEKPFIVIDLFEWNIYFSTFYCLIWEFSWQEMRWILSSKLKCFHTYVGQSIFFNWSIDGGKVSPPSYFVF